MPTYYKMATATILIAFYKTSYSPVYVTVSGKTYHIANSMKV